MSLFNKRFVLAAVLFGVTASMTIYEAGEIDASEYRVLRDEFKLGTPAYQAAIAQAMHNGEISRWEYRQLLGQYRNQRTMLLIDNDATNLREERLVLTAMTRVRSSIDSGTRP